MFTAPHVMNIFLLALSNVVSSSILGMTPLELAPSGVSSIIVGSPEVVLLSVPFGFFSAWLFVFLRLRPIRLR